VGGGKKGYSLRGVPGQVFFRVLRLPTPPTAPTGAGVDVRALLARHLLLVYTGKQVGQIHKSDPSTREGGMGGLLMDPHPSGQEGTLSLLREEWGAARGLLIPHLTTLHRFLAATTADEEFSPSFGISDLTALSPTAPGARPSAACAEALLLAGPPGGCHGGQPDQERRRRGQRTPG
jgi:hypothetical protein